MRQVSVRYGASGPWAVDGIDLEVMPGDSIGIVGESGSGKSTIGGVICGLIPPTRGTVDVLGTPWARVRRLSPERRAVQMIFQDPYESLNPMLTALKTVSEVYRVWDRKSAKEAERSAAATLEEVGISGSLLNRRADKLSGGQRQRVGIARVLACQPSLIVADEPTSALDVSVQATVLNLLQDLRDSRTLALVLISHDLSVVEYMTSYAYVMHNGKIVERGSTEHLMSTPDHEYTRTLIESIPRLEVHAGHRDA